MADFPVKVGRCARFLAEKRARVGRFCARIVLSDKLLENGYQLLTKLKNHQRTQKLVRIPTQFARYWAVQHWYPDPKVPNRFMGWVEVCHPFARQTLQINIRTERAGKPPTERVLLTSLSAAQAIAMLGRARQQQRDPAQVALAVAHLYDQRGGGVKTQIRQDKQALRLAKRNKKRFAAQEMLVLLAELAHNLLTWICQHLAQAHVYWKGWGLLRLVRDVFHIPSKVKYDARGRPLCLILHRHHFLGGPLLLPLRTLVGSKLSIILDKF